MTTLIACHLWGIFFEDLHADKLGRGIEAGWSGATGDDG